MTVPLAAATSLRRNHRTRYHHRLALPFRPRSGKRLAQCCRNVGSVSQFWLPRTLAGKISEPGECPARQQGMEGFTEGFLTVFGLGSPVRMTCAAPSLWCLVADSSGYLWLGLN